MKRSIGVFCVFLQVDFAKIEQNEDRVLRGVSQKTCKKLQKTPLFEEQKLWKTCHFGSFWTFIERKNFFILGRFLEISLEIFQLFSHFNYLRAHQLFLVTKSLFFLILGAGVRAEVQNHKNWNYVIPTVGWREMSDFHRFFHFFEKKWIRNDQNLRNCSNYGFFRWWKSRIFDDFEHRFQEIKIFPNSISLGGVALTFPYVAKFEVASSPTVLALKCWGNVSCWHISTGIIIK